MAKHTITNSAEGPRGVALADGTTLFIEPGQTVEDVDVAKDHKLYEGLEKLAMRPPSAPLRPARMPPRATKPA
jgi:hypothetical protein